MLNEKNYDYMDRSLPDDGGRSLEEIISDAEEKAFEAIPAVPMTPERLVALAAERDAADGVTASAADSKNVGKSENKTDRRKRTYKLAGGIAAVLALILIGAFVAFNTLSEDVGADKKQKEEIVTEDGVVIEDGGYGAEYEDGDVWRTEDWDAVAAAKTLYPRLLIPEYIPEGYEFASLNIQYLETQVMVSEYIFLNNQQEIIEIEIFSETENLLSMDIGQYTNTLMSSKGCVYLHKDEKKATIQTDDGNTITIWSSFSEEEIIKIIDNLVS